MTSVAHYGFTLLTAVKEIEMHKTELKCKPVQILACAVLAFSATAFAGSALAADSPRAGSVQASTATADSGKRMHHRGDYKRGHKHQHRRMRDAAMLIPGYGPVPKDVVEALSLNEEQTVLLDDAKSFITDHRKSQREQFRQRRSDQSAQKSATPLDPHAAVKMQQERFEAMREVREESTKKWLTLWDSLESGQQQTLNEYVESRNEQRAQRRAEHKEKRTARNNDNS